MLYHDIRQASAVFDMATLPQFKKKHWIALGIGLIILVGLALWLWPVSQPAKASFTLQPESKKVKKGDKFEVVLEVVSTSPANAIDATVHYPTDQLQVVSTSSKDSRFDMVLFPAKAEAGKGTVRFIQATALPFHGASGGKVGTIIFKATKDGTVTYSVSGKIVANDAHGTDLTAKPKDKRLWQELLP